MTQAAIECSGVPNGFDDVPAPRDVTTTFAAGAVTVLAGEEGHGTSTRFPILAGQLPA